MTIYYEIHRNTYLPEHRLHMNEVFDELLYVTNIVWCDNEKCELEIDKRNAIYKKIVCIDCYFCSDNCQSYGDWSIRYDLRKEKRRNT